MCTFFSLYRTKLQEQKLSIEHQMHLCNQEADTKDDNDHQ